jgi:hypothetical protein
MLLQAQAQAACMQGSSPRMHAAVARASTARHATGPCLALQPARAASSTHSR